MRTTSINQTLTLAGFTPAGKLNHTCRGSLPLSGPLVAALGKLNLGKRACAVLVLCAATAIALPAQTFTTLFNFDGTDGALSLGGLVQAANGDFYGTTQTGGANNWGTIFKITSGGTLTTLYSFCSQSGCPDGKDPGGLVQGVNGDFYGTTDAGGANASCDSGFGCGTVFQITPSGALETLYSFCSEGGTSCTDGAYPNAWLVQAANGDFYGTTQTGGANGEGTVFKITPSGTLTTLHSFCSQGGTACSDGEDPRAGLVQANNGDFYGTTFFGGAGGDGTLFKITPTGTLTTLYEFCPGGFQCPDGAGPSGALVQAAGGDFYGTTPSGGNDQAVGTVFKITPDGALTTLVRFCAGTVYPDCPDGAAPYAGLVQATDGNFYGTTVNGGANPGPFGDGAGTIFKITPGGTLTTLYNFCSQIGCTDGHFVNAALFQGTDGELYGTTGQGGTVSSSCSLGCGTLFSLSVGLGPFVEPQTTSGEVGGEVKILGTDLTGVTSVTFNSTAAVFEVVSPSLIVAKVPAGATTGKVHVVTPSGTLSSNVSFRVLP